MTDYTDSLIVKVFARDDDDDRMLSAVKKGMWIQAAGRVEDDSFMHSSKLLILFIKYLLLR